MSNNNQAICATLEIKNLYSESKNTLHDLFMLQKDIQENVYGYDFKKMQDFGFAAQKFYFVLSLILIILSFVHYYFSINKLSLFNYYLIAMVFLAIFKMLYYMFHRQQPLPKDWYYKILYICTFQILPMLALWKFLFI